MHLLTRNVQLRKEMTLLYNLHKLHVIQTNQKTPRGSGKQEGHGQANVPSSRRRERSPGGSGAAAQPRGPSAAAQRHRAPRTGTGTAAAALQRQSTSSTQRSCNQGGTQHFQQLPCYK